MKALRRANVNGRVQREKFSGSKTEENAAENSKQYAGNRAQYKEEIYRKIFKLEMECIINEKEIRGD